MLREDKKEEGRIAKEREKESRKYLKYGRTKKKKKKKKKKGGCDMSIQEKIDQELRRGRKIKGKLQKRTTKSACLGKYRGSENQKKRKERKGKEGKGKKEKEKERERKKGGANT